MTREAFQEIDTWSELEQVAADYDYEDELSDVYTKGSYESYAKDDILEACRSGESLETIKSMIENFPDPIYYDRFIRDYYDGTWRGSDDNDNSFRDYKDTIFGRMEDNDEFDPENEDEDIEPDPTLYEDENEEHEVQPEPEPEPESDMFEVLNIMNEVEIPEEEINIDPFTVPRAVALEEAYEKEAEEAMAEEAERELKAEEEETGMEALEELFVQFIKGA